MQRPLFLEREPGTGKTGISKVLAAGLNRPLVRLQCYDGMDLSAAAYEWDHARQLISIRLAEAAGQTGRDELDRADDPFEAFLLELLADFQITIPEYGTVKAATRPVDILTSNRTREVHDAIRRRCLYHWVDYPDAARERAILAVKAPGVPDKLAQQVVDFVQRLRGEELFKLPGVAETIDWAQALTYLNKIELTAGDGDDTLGVLPKYQDDIPRVRAAEAARLVTEVGAING